MDTRTLTSGLIHTTHTARTVSRILRDGRRSMGGSGRGMMVSRRCMERVTAQWEYRVSIQRSRLCHAGAAMNRSIPMRFTVTSAQSRLFLPLLCRRLSHRHKHRTRDIRLPDPTMPLRTPILILPTHTRTQHPHKRRQPKVELRSPTLTFPPPPYHFDQLGLPTRTNDVFWNGTLIAHLRSRCSVRTLLAGHNKEVARAAHRP